MRDFKGMKRQRGRNRNGGGGGGRPQHNTNRAFDSNGPDGVKVRGAAQHVYEKYQQLARDAHTAGDRVVAENYLQHAEHYFRVMRAMQPQRPLAEIVGRDQFVSGYDIDFEDESGQNESTAVEMEADGRDNGAERSDRSDTRRDERPREDFRQGEPRARDDRGQNDRNQFDRGANERPQAERSLNDRPPSDRPQNDRPPNDRSRDDRQGRNFRDDRPRYNRDDRPAAFERQDRSDRDSHGLSEPLAPSPAASAEPEDRGGVLRADDGEVNHAPAFLQVRPSEPRESSPGDGRPRRRRGPRPLDGQDGQPEPTQTEEV
jgi:hypothetical protein